MTFQPLMTSQEVSDQKLSLTNFTNKNVLSTRLKYRIGIRIRKSLFSLDSSFLTNKTIQTRSEVYQQLLQC